MRRRTAALTLVLLWGMGLAYADEAPRVTGITTAREGDQVVCRLTTSGLPGERLLQSMRSGLVSEVAIEATLLDDKRRVLGATRLSLRLAFDLWDEVFSVRGGDAEQRFTELSELAAYLGALEPMALAPLTSLTPSGRYQVHVGLQVHPVASESRERVGDVIAGDQRPRREGDNAQEASVSLGRLIRFFYAGGGDKADGLEILSAWFTLEELDHAAH